MPLPHPRSLCGIGRLYKNNIDWQKLGCRQIVLTHILPGRGKAILLVQKPEYPAGIVVAANRVCSRGGY